MQSNQQISGSMYLSLQQNDQRIHPNVSQLCANCHQILHWIIGQSRWLERKSMSNSLQTITCFTTVNMLLLSLFY